jgi:hypothetical protein
MNADSASINNAEYLSDPLDEVVEKDTTDFSEDRRGVKQADILIGLTSSAELFHSDGTGFADLEINGHRETWPIRSKIFRCWLAHRYFDKTQSAPNSQAMQSALNVIEARANFDSPGRSIHVRVGGLDNKIYLDLGDETWRAVEIDASGWRVIDRPPVRASAVLLGCRLCRCRCQADQSKCCALSSMCGPTPTLCWWSPGHWLACVIEAPIQ